MATMDATGAATGVTGAIGATGAASAVGATGAQIGATNATGAAIGDAPNGFSEFTITGNLTVPFPGGSPGISVGGPWLMMTSLDDPTNFTLLGSTDPTRGFHSTLTRLRRFHISSAGSNPSGGKPRSILCRAPYFKTVS